MTTFAIGPVHGDFALLSRLLKRIAFDRNRDCLWFCGNLVNRGPDSLAILRFVKDLGRKAVVVLGAEELRLLAVAEGIVEPRDTDTFTEILTASDREPLLKWLYQRPLLHHEANYTMVHAGIPAEWSLSQARTFAIEAESSLAMGNHRTFFENIVGDNPSRWHAKLRGWKRLRFIVNALTRMSVCDDSGRFDFSNEIFNSHLAEGMLPWYRQPDRAMAGQAIICGYTFDKNESSMPTTLFPLQSIHVIGSLSALRLSDTPELITVSPS